VLVKPSGKRKILATGLDTQFEKQPVGQISLQKPITSGATNQLPPLVIARLDQAIQ
jgi:hypothetical protein